MFVSVLLFLVIGLVSAQETIILNSDDNPSVEVTVGDGVYTIELVSASDTAATIRVTDGSGDFDNKEVNEGESKEINGLEVMVISANEENLYLEAEISITGADVVDGDTDDNGNDEQCGQNLYGTDFCLDEENGKEVVSCDSCNSCSCFGGEVTCTEVACPDDGDDDKDKVKICHIPPGNPGRAHTIEIGAPAFNTHLAHGDFEGECGAGDKTEIEERIKIVGVDGVEREVKIKRRIRSDGTIERRFRYREKDVLSEIEIEEVVDDSDFTRRKLRAKLSNGRFAEIKVMPEVAAERALKRLRLKFCLEENGCEIRLKEVIKSGDTKAVYELKTKRKARFLGIFPVDMEVSAEVDVESGEVVGENKPAWAFLATEPEEV